MAHEEARAMRGEGGSRGGVGGGLVWDVVVPRLGERVGRQIGVVGNASARQEGGLGAGRGDSGVDSVFEEGEGGARRLPSPS